MTRVAYKYRSFAPQTLALIRRADAICEEYGAQGYDLTLRQIYYQFVARDLLPNSQASYDRLGRVVSDARMAGLLSWDYIVDRTRNLRSLSHWDSPAGILDAAAASYARDKWEGQSSRVEVWVEKEALAGVVERSASALDVPFFSCRGYVSQSEMWRAGRRIGRHLATPGVERVVILHLGDHDPSGMDMTRDVKERLRHFIGVDYARGRLDEIAPGGAQGDDAMTPETRTELRGIIDGFMGRLEVRRIALNMDQIHHHNPPPNPGKTTDARAKGYVRRYGRQSWELDALPPDVLDELIRSHVDSELDHHLFAAVQEQEARERGRIQTLARTWAGN